MLVLGFATFGLFGIVLAVVAIRANRHRAKCGIVSARWLVARRWSWLLGAALGIGSYFLWYPLHDGGETWRVMGFPFFAAAFDSRGSDYVGIGSPGVLVLRVPNSSFKADGFAAA
jgi:hypothetical protein